ncbi:MAG: trigger factor, partial [Bacilli bacterium]
YHADNLAGKEATFKVKVLDVKRKELPELDDEFAKDVSDFDTLEEYKSDLENKLKEKKEHEKEHYVRDAVVKAATENATIELPQAMIDNEIDQMKEDFIGRLEQQGMNLDLYFQFTGSDESALREQFLSDAETRVRTNLVLEAIADKEAVEVTDEEVDAELNRLAELYSRSVEEIRGIFTARDGLFGIRQDIKINKTIDMLVENSKEVSAE